MPSDPGHHMLARLQTILNEKPLLMSLLRENPPIDINLATLLEVLDTLKEPGVSDSNIKAFLSRPALEWSNEVFRNQSANIDPAAAESKLDISKLKAMFSEMTGLKDTAIWDQMWLLSLEMEATPGVLYKHDPY
jgi:hypothetical protein